MEVKKYPTKVTFTLHDGTTVVADDSVVAGQGDTALHCFEEMKYVRISSATDGQFTLIPYHAIIKAEVEITSSTETVVDDLCK